MWVYLALLLFFFFFCLGTRADVIRGPRDAFAAANASKQTSGDATEEHGELEVIPCIEAKIRGSKSAREGIAKLPTSPTLFHRSLLFPQPLSEDEVRDCQSGRLSKV
ncbi:hypothetical protein BDP67DRAFT_609890 [Colletotrichum lupini]|nr:hypothetical protein BDP67DRAFT_609890 [Colletotrichum lupini]